MIIKCLSRFRRSKISGIRRERSEPVKAPIRQERYTLCFRLNTVAAYNVELQKVLWVIEARKVNINENTSSGRKTFRWHMVQTCLSTDREELQLLFGSPLWLRHLTAVGSHPPYLKGHHPRFYDREIARLVSYSNPTAFPWSLIPSSPSGYPCVLLDMSSDFIA